MKLDAKPIGRRPLRRRTAWAARVLAGAMLAAGGCAPTWNLSPPQSEGQSFTSARPLASGLTRVEAACFSPDMNWVLLQGAARGEHEAQLYVAQLRWDKKEEELEGTYPPVRCTPRGSQNAAGSFSPDGNSLIFSSTATRTTASLPGQDQDTAAERLDRWAFPPTMEIYRADGWQGAVAALAPGGSTDLARHALTHNQVWDGQGTYSPDGRWIVFTSRRDGGVAQLFVMEADGTHPKRLTHSSGYAGDAVFSPDGKSILYRAQAKKDGPLQIFSADVVYDTNRQLIALANDRQLTDAAAGAGQPAWHPDGKHVVYAMMRPEGQNEDLYLMRRDGSHKTRITLDPAVDGHPAFSPDGHWLLWISTRTGDGMQVFIARFTFALGT